MIKYHLFTLVVLYFCYLISKRNGPFYDTSTEFFIIWLSNHCGNRIQDFNENKKWHGEMEGTKMGLWEMLKGSREALKKVKFIYEPYRNAKVAYVTKKRWKALHKNGTKVINMVEKALSEYGVTYFADYGTLLGIIRDHDFIQWDDDMDYGLIVNNQFDWSRFEKHMRQYGFTKIKEFNLMGKTTEQAYRYKNVSIDFFEKRIEEERLISYIYFRKKEYEYLSKQDFHVRKMKYAIVNATERIMFKNTYVSVPINSEQYLESAYSKNWRIPDSNCDVYKLKVELEELDAFGKGISFKWLS